MNEYANLSQTTVYEDKDIVTLEGLDAVRKRPGMYIGNTHGGEDRHDGIYVLLKEVIDNSIDEFRMKAGTRIDLTIDEGHVSVRDYGRGIPQGNLAKTVSTLHTSGKFGSEAFKKSIGLNGVGIKAVNALSTDFTVVSYRDQVEKKVEFQRGKLVCDAEAVETKERNGTLIRFTPDPSIFENYAYRHEFVEALVRNYCYLNSGLSIYYNGEKYISEKGLEDLLNENITDEILYPIVHLKANDIEIAFTHVNQSRDDYYSFVNGQYTSQGGTHQAAFKESFARTVKEFYNKNLEVADIRSGLVAAIYIGVEEPEFESQTKIKLGSRNMSPKGNLSVAKFIGDFIKKEVDNYLHKNPETADALYKKIQESEKERKAIAGVAKLARERAKKVNLHNRKLRDCRIHLNDGKSDNKTESSIFITEGDSASGSITKSRDPNLQAVFSLRGKPLNCFGLTKKVVYENEEFNLLQAALNIEDGLDGLRYNRVIIATDADVDGMHIRLLLITFFLQFFPDLVKQKHVFILQTPLFRVRNKQKTIYCYNEEEKNAAIHELGKNPEITRFKGLGEISPDEFKHFIGKEMRLDPVSIKKEDAIKELLEFYMGKNTMERQNFIIDNLVVEEDLTA
ncbi:DNA topoisomerase IV subunit B [Tannerella forsythia]|jgi:Type IIA topoisomerase (DNA gyrase/topo II, topoisomerase IV), B subunit|uniref:DNA topoisomerase (ATP-hydrolyzing) n=2 Tax=Tannerella forsythia TaxID=28112 RepID=G8UHR5_TANFA|nr:DNA topoisomerase IV subunit B [Tannerella forsythia]AEW22269.1 putative DNA gyrase, B subunit [Tannerella forsythia 92A2]PDP44208.1 type IIA DNA topoisomerase subunit B [Tannerella forsythia]SCQ19672.1 DNA topoisomerase 4 subunit B [Tannerella forsythia]SCQ20556.1 DNA topoisomerase 4 subunit B [Tannerella forsythia]